jgi:hypothetical protein
MEHMAKDIRRKRGMKNVYKRCCVHCTNQYSDAKSSNIQKFKNQDLCSRFFFFFKTYNSNTGFFFLNINTQKF